MTTVRDLQSCFISFNIKNRRMEIDLELKFVTYKFDIWPKIESCLIPETFKIHPLPSDTYKQQLITGRGFQSCVVVIDVDAFTI